MNNLWSWLDNMDNRRLGFTFPDPQAPKHHLYNWVSGACSFLLRCMAHLLILILARASSHVVQDLLTFIASKHIQSNAHLVIAHRLGLLICVPILEHHTLNVLAAALHWTHCPSSIAPSCMAQDICSWIWYLMWPLPHLCWLCSSSRTTAQVHIMQTA